MRWERQRPRRRLPPRETLVRWMLLTTVLVGVPATLVFGAIATGVVSSSDVGGTPLEPVVADIEDSIDESHEENTLDETETELLIHQRVNEVRQEEGLPPLEWSSTLADDARGHSEDMADRDFYAHENPDGEGPQGRTSTNCRVGENLGAPYWQITFRDDGESVRLESEEELAEYVVDGWMSSREHRENILREEYVAQGVGIESDGSEVYVTQMFCAPP